MGRWLASIRSDDDKKKSETPERGTPKTPKTQQAEVSGVLGVSDLSVSKNFMDVLRGGFGGFGGMPSGAFANFFRDGRSLEDLQAAFEERAAIMEYDGGMTREEAEAMALKNILGLLH